MASQPAIGSTEELELRLGVTFTEADSNRANAILEDVSALARRESGDSTRWVSNDGETATAPDEVVAVVLAAARRQFVNPNGFASEQDGDYSYRLPAGVLTGGVFTEAEQKLLRSYAPNSGLWTQKITGSPETTQVLVVVGEDGKPIEILDTYLDPSS